ncbi:MAG: hypothetical protein KatS3mg127_0293 [Silanimonas sp.]|nr:MAG: hypothetical protein KatS3mg127_0293 [Silanimonas sp.]
MARSGPDRLRRLELALLGLGALASAALLLVKACGGLAPLAGRMELPGVQLTLYVAKLALTETALLAPHLVLGLLGRALLRETRQRRYRWAGLLLSAVASLGVVAMLAAGLVAIDLEDALDRLVAGVVPALILLAGCALAYGALIWRAQHARLEPFSAPES